MTDFLINSNLKHKNDLESASQNVDKIENTNDFNSQFTFSAEEWKKYANKNSRFCVSKVLNKMQSAVQLNIHLKRESGNANLIIINIPTPPKSVNPESVKNCKFYLTIFKMDYLIYNLFF